MDSTFAMFAKCRKLHDKHDALTGFRSGLAGRLLGYVQVLQGACATCQFKSCGECRGSCSLVWDRAQSNFQKIELNWTNIDSSWHAKELCPAAIKWRRLTASGTKCEAVCLDRSPAGDGGNCGVSWGPAHDVRTVRCLLPHPRLSGRLCEASHRMLMV